MELNKIILGDCLDKLKELEDNSVDSIVTDPPYELGFMGKSWDNTGIANDKNMWAECLRVLKPGGHLLAFSGTRTYHRMAVAIEDAGFEVRDMIEWVYGSGFPKSLNISKAIEKMNGVEPLEKIPNKGERFYGQEGSDYHLTPNRLVMPETQTEDGKKWEGWGTAFKPAHEPICMARKPLAEKTVAKNVLKYGTGGINIDESRVGTEVINIHNAPKGTFAGGEPDRGSDTESYRDSVGRFPANLIHDNSEEVRECFPETTHAGNKRESPADKGMFGIGREDFRNTYGNDGSSASRFFKSIIYQAKASKSERNIGCEGLEDSLGGSLEGGNDKRNGNKPQLRPTKNNHPTVKPIALMEYLIKMVTPKGGIVLDPFAGSGSTLVAAKQNGFRYIGIEMTEEYIPIIEARLKAVKQQTLL